MENQLIPFLVSFSNKRRRVIEDQKKQQYMLRKTTLTEQLIFNTVPVIFTSTILAPLNRLKILFQVKYSITDEKNFKLNSILNIIKQDQGWIAFFRGNASNNYKILVQTGSRIILFDRIKYFFMRKSKVLSDKKYKIPSISYINKILSSLISGFLTLIITYPFDLVHTCISSDMSRKHEVDKKHKTFLYLKTMHEDSGRNFFGRDKAFFLEKYYKGFSLAVLGFLPNIVITMTGYSIFSEKIQSLSENKGRTYFQTFINVLGVSSFVSLISSSICYPIDTLKRNYQISGIDRNVKQYLSINHLFKNIYGNHGIQGLYSGFSFHMARTIPFGFFQYNIYLLLCAGFLKENPITEEKDKKNETNSK